MFISISWHPTTASRPRIEQTTDLAEILRSAYLAGLRGDALVIDEYRSSDTRGDTQWRLLDSTSITVGDLGERKEGAHGTAQT
jgi:hypothetical protein